MNFDTQYLSFQQKINQTHQTQIKPMPIIKFLTPVGELYESVSYDESDTYLDTIHKMELLQNERKELKNKIHAFYDKHFPDIKKKFLNFSIKYGKICIAP